MLATTSLLALNPPPRLAITTAQLVVLLRVVISMKCLQFKPTIEASLQKVGATKNWNTIITQYNRFTLKKINPDLTAYVTERALMGIFSQIAIEEKNIRKDPLARSTDVLKKVFGNNASK